MVTPELAMSRHLQHWPAEKNFFSVQHLLPEKHPDFQLISKVYAIVQASCSTAPLRKNGEHPFLHPLNVALNLRRASMYEVVPLCIGLLHDLVEDDVDAYREKNKLIENDRFAENAQILQQVETYRQECFACLERELVGYGTEEQRKSIIAGVRLVTRRRTQSYYRYIGGMFQDQQQSVPEQSIPEQSVKLQFVKEMALQVKLADRIHNVLCIAQFTEETRIHECFKNIFMLNNVKKYLLDVYGKEIFFKKPSPSLERLFAQCCKATYDAFLTICQLALEKGIGKFQTVLQLALMKFAHEMAGMWEVTQLNKNEVHPLRLYQGVVRKYDVRLRQEKDKFADLKADELRYCQKFFEDYDCTDEQLQAILDYKDAYGLKEVVARLLYLPDYVLSGFLTSELAVEKEGFI